MIDLYFDSETHQYYWKGEKVPCVSDLCKMIDCLTMSGIPPQTLVKAFRLESITAEGKRECIFESKENIKRNLFIPIEKSVRSVCLIIDENWGNTQESGVFTFELFE